VLIRAALRLWESGVPVQKMDAVAALARHVSINPAVFAAVHGLKTGTTRRRDVLPAALFDDYLHNIEAIVDAVNRANEHLKTIPEAKWDWKKAATRFYEQHPDPFIWSPQAPNLR